jgi:hypothetical protein
MSTMPVEQDRAHQEQRKYKHGFDIESPENSDDSDCMSSNDTTVTFQNEFQPNAGIGEGILQTPISPSKGDVNSSLTNVMVVHRAATNSTTLPVDNLNPNNFQQDITIALEQTNETIDESSRIGNSTTPFSNIKGFREGYGKFISPQRSHDNESKAYNGDAPMQSHKRAYSEFLAPHEAQQISHSELTQVLVEKNRPRRTPPDSFRNREQPASLTKQLRQDKAVDILLNDHQRQAVHEISPGMTEQDQLPPKIEPKNLKTRVGETQKPFKQDGTPTRAAERKDSPERRQLEMERFKNAELSEQIKLLLREKDESKELLISIRNRDNSSTFDLIYPTSTPPSSLLAIKQHNTMTSNAHKVGNEHQSQLIQ